MAEDYTWDGSATGFAMANSALIQRVQQLERENAELRARLDAVPVEALRKLRAHLSDDGDYSICRTDKESMFWGDVIMLGGLLETISKWLDTPQVQP